MHHSGNELINPFRALERVGIRSGWQVADFGCGALGHFVFPAAQMVGGDGRVYAVDIQKEVVHAIEHTMRREQYWNVVPVWGDIEVVRGVRIPNNTLDLIIIANNMYLSRNRHGLLQEALRVTRPHGHLLIIEWKREPTVIGPSIEHRLSIDEMKQLCQHPELELEENFDAGDHHYALLYRRSVSENIEVISVSQPLYHE